MSRSISQVVESLRTGLRSMGSKLASFSVYGNIYALFRSVASVITEHEVEAENIKDGFFLSTSTGGDLDRRALDFNIARKPGSPSIGYILAQSPSNTFIPRNTILSSADNGIQVETVSDISLSQTERPIEISSLSLTQDANLSAGTNLFSSSYSHVKFTVGTFRNPLTQQVEGGLRGGREIESDYQLRDRVKNHLANLSKGTYASIINAVLNVSSISKVFVKEHKPLTGFITIYIDSNELTVIRRVKTAIERTKAAGVSYLVRPLTRLDLIISLEIEVSKNSNLDTIVRNVKAGIFNYLDNLDVGAVVTSEAIAGTALSVSGVTNVRMTYPRGTIVLEPEQVVSVSNINISTVLGR